jgi:hypothetical protein
MVSPAESLVRMDPTRSCGANPAVWCTLLKSEMRAVLMMENTHYDFSFPSLRDDGQLLISDLKSDV